MKHTMSPNTPRHETNGMLAAKNYALARPGISGQELRAIANRLWQHYALNKHKYEFANGLRDGLYLISQTRDTT